MPALNPLEFVVSANEAGQRLDVALVARMAVLTRSRAALLIRADNVRVDGRAEKPSYRVKAGQLISTCIPAPEPAQAAAEAIPLDIIHEDPDLIVVNKPPGMVVHPAAGHAGGTLVNALLHYCPNLKGIGGTQRPGIVHRLDKDTSGLVVVAKNDRAHVSLSQQFKSRQIQKTYLAIVHGLPGAAKGTIDLPIGRHPVDRKRMAVAAQRGRQALTIWRLVERLVQAALVEFDLRTGRTHQIRVHCQAIGHPIVGDPVYGFRRTRRERDGRESEVHAILSGAQRQLLHAMQLGFSHPVSGAALSFSVPVPQDMSKILQELRELSR